MRKSDLSRFFKTAAQQIQVPVKVYLTGGVAAWFWGGIRPTIDLDFALKTEDHWEEIAEVFREVSDQLNIPVEFSEDISRWGMIGFPQFEKNAKFYQRWGKIRVYFLDPLVWSVGKMARYTSDDVADLEAVFKKQKVSPKKVIQIWARAFRESPRSTEQSLFQKKVADFLKHSGPKIWGKTFDAETLIATFKNQCIQTKR